MKYKTLTKEQLLLSVDRLTRFKPTYEKYYRVFSDIVSSCLIEPVYKKQELSDMQASRLRELAENIINDSLNSIERLSDDKENSYECNKILNDYEESVFYLDNDSKEFLNNKINYKLFKNLIDESCPINLRWLKIMIDNCNLIASDYGVLNNLRRDKGLKFPIQKVLLVEGITEEILLPAFSKYLGFDFYKEGIQIIAAGGKNQVVKMYYKLINELKIPIFVLLDKDAEENISQIKPKLRDIDKIHLVSCGEFEDLLPKSLVIKTLNNELTNFASVSCDDFDDSISAVKNLENIFKTKGLHEFKKADFAKLVKDNISCDFDISQEIKSIIEEIKA